MQPQSIEAKRTLTRLRQRNAPLMLELEKGSRRPVIFIRETALHFWSDTNRGSIAPHPACLTRYLARCPAAAPCGDATTLKLHTPKPALVAMPDLSDSHDARDAGQVRCLPYGKVQRPSQIMLWPSSPAARASAALKLGALARSVVARSLTMDEASSWYLSCAQANSHFLISWAMHRCVNFLAARE